MITHVDITSSKYEIDAITKRYVMGKIGRLDRYLPRHARKTVRAEVKLREVNRANGNKYEAEVILIVPDNTIVAKDSTMNMLAAVDIVEQKLKNQLRRYKDEHKHRRGHRLWRRFRLQRG